MRKILKAILAMELFFCVCVVGVYRGSLYVEAGTAQRSSDRIASDTVEWDIDENGVLTVTGEGYLNFSWSERKDEIRSAVLNWAGMSGLENLFFGCKNLVSVDLTRQTLGT